MRLPHLCLIASLLLAAQTQAQEQAGLARYLGGGFSDRLLGGTDLTLELSQGVPWRVFTLTDPYRLVLDFREVDWQGGTLQELDQSELVLAVRAGPVRQGWSRLVAELAEPAKVASAALALDPDSAQARLSLSLQASTASEFQKNAGLPKDPQWDSQRAVQKAPAADTDDRLTIMLDPGHGGIDPGAQRAGVNEADLMLRFAFELQDVLRRTGRYKVMMTRTGDEFVSLEGRVAKAHEAGADLFISLHADALAEGHAHGATVYTLSDEASDAASQALAERHDRDNLLSGVDLSGADDQVAQVLLDLARLDNGPRSLALSKHLVGGIKNALGHVHKKPERRAGFSVLKAADIPSVLIELGFLSTDQDLVNLQDPVWRAGMAAGIRDGIAQWAIEDQALSRLRRQ